jgi:predicted ester cyclase
MSSPISVSARRWVASATNTGPVMGMPPTGGTVRLTGVNVARFADDKIVMVQL